ncbi:leucine-rich repeat serine/threonine-protein kinase 2 isoform X2 [Octopus sinensis]|uniref:non-specific serine/threonine protein kinase n=1 Tax=Octopus sinensis TaxID=2607531 RepID=A0A6P7SY33_9MOLL|nr:leucine-rich repeat serine/threonine-protein kinase 2 isoform X2 [Octopus sinensis]
MIVHSEPREIVLPSHVSINNVSSCLLDKNSTEKTIVETCQRAIVSLSQLEQDDPYFSVKIIVQALLNLFKEQLKTNDLDIKQHLQNCMIENICILMTSRTKDYQLQQMNFQILERSLWWNVSKLAVEYQSLPKLVMNIMQEHLTDEIIQASGMKLMKLFVNKSILVNVDQKEVAELSLVLLAGFKESVDVQTAALQTLNQLFETEVLPLDFFVSNLHIFDALCFQSLLKQDIFEAVLPIYSIISSSSEYLCHTLIENNIHEHLCTILCKYLKNESLLEMIMKMLVNLENKTVFCYLADTGFIARDLSKIIRDYSENICITIEGLKLLKIAVSFHCVDQIEKWIFPIYNSLFKHMVSSKVQITGYKTVVEILKNYPEFINTIGEDSTKNQYPIHTLCLGTILQQNEDSNIYVTACEAIYWLAAGNDHVSDLFMLKNTYQQILGIMQSHQSNAAVVLSSCRALRALCLFRPYNERLQITQDTCIKELFENLFTSFIDNPAILMEAMCVLANLLECNTKVLSIVIHHSFYNIISAMKQFSDYVLIQESALEVLIVASKSDWGRSQLQQEEIVKLFIDIMARFTENLCIQRKALYLLQMVLSKDLSSQLYVKMAKIVINLMYTYPLVSSIQIECCILILLHQNLEAYPDKHIFINQKCQTPVFSNALHSNPNSELFDSACRCLKSLCSGINKSVMLMYACAEGRYIEAECLLSLGADVNFKHNAYTPLLHACGNGDEHIVRLILQKPVSDILTPLKLAIENKYHTIVGILLSYIGQQEQDGAILWNGLGLGSFNFDWLIPTFVGDHYIKHPSAGKGKKLARKIQSIHKSGKNPSCGTYNRYFAHDSGSSYSSSSSDESNGSDIHFIEWKRTTLSGSTSPFHINDPRFYTVGYCRGKSSLYVSQLSHEPWLRKSCFLTDTSLPEIGCLAPEDAAIYCEIHLKSKKKNLASPILEGKKFQFYNISPVKEREFHSDEDCSNSDDFQKPFHERKCPSLIIRSKKIVMNSHVDQKHFTLNLADNNILDFISTTLRNAVHQKCLQFLQKLNVSNNQLDTISEDLFNFLPELKELDMSNNNLQKFPTTVLNCSHLETLKMKHNKIEDFEVISCATSPVLFSLKKLNLSGNTLKQFPSWLTEHFPGLEYLYLKNMKMTVIENKPLQLRRLLKLNLSGNQITTIPELFFIGCNKLTIFKMNENNLEKLPSEKVLNELPMLQSLHLTHNNLGTKEPWYLPKFILKLRSLVCLDLRFNNLTNICPPAMWACEELKKLYISDNLICDLDLSKGAKNWSNLEVLDISHNLLSNLPRQIGHLKSLRSLNFSYNKGITCLPDELGACDKIWEMPLDGLEISLSRTLMKGRVRDIILDLSYRLKNCQRQYSMKMMVMGYGGHGKTTLIRSLMKEKKQATGTATVGIVVKRWIYKHYRHKKTVNYCITTWDFAGQEDFYSTHQCFISRQAIYLVVFDLRHKQTDILKCWLANIQAQAPGCPVLVVGTHYDLIPHDDESIQEIKNKIFQFQRMPHFPKIYDVIMVDTRTENKNMEHLRNTIKTVIDSYKVHGEPVMGRKVPANYLKLSEVVTNTAATLKNDYPVLNYQEMMALLKMNQLNMSQEEFNQGVHFLDNTGVLRHFDEAGHQLKDLYFIDPAWLCRMLAQIVTVKQINPYVTEQGTIHQKHLKMLFTGKIIDSESNYVFPPSHIPQYIKLLEKFEIALPKNQDELLIPCRLPTVPPQVKIPKSNFISRIYRMPLAPTGIWMRLLARLIAFFQKPTLFSATVPKEIEYYCRGLYVYWSDDMYFHLEMYHAENDEIHIKVPASHGSRLMGEIADHIDSLIEEWYPGLLATDIFGNKTVQILAPCPYCPEENKHLFDLEYLIEKSDTTSFVKCPNHDGIVLLSLVAPDITLNDLDKEFHLQQEQFQLQKISKNLLGKGEYGVVYQASYRNSHVAVKLFLNNAINHPHKILRKETTILRRLKHPSVVCLLAVGLKPRMMVMELATHGSLGHALASKKIVSVTLAHRIALQIAEGLMYLHGLQIIYRDLKPANVLVFSLSTTCLINVKISDYGISQLSTFYGLTANEGTPGYQAPEVIKKENYSFQADIFSYGILLYALLSGGKHPYGHLLHPSEMEQAILTGERISLSLCNKFGSWPDMLDLLSQCLMYVPSNRPTSKELCTCLRNPEMLCLKDVKAVSKSFPPACMTFQKNNTEENELWLTCDSETKMELSWIELSNTAVNLQGFIVNIQTPLCLHTAKHVILLGCINGSIAVFDAEKKILLHSSVQLLDSVLCICSYTRFDYTEFILAGTANGYVAVFKLDSLIEEGNNSPVYLHSFGLNEPVLCIQQHGDSIYASCGTSVYKLHFSSSVFDSEIYDREDCFCFTARKMKRKYDGSCLSIIDENTQIINKMMFHDKLMYITHRSSSTVEMWDISKDCLRNCVNIIHFLDTETNMSRITATCLHAATKILWIGTGGGHLVLLDCYRLQPLITLHRHIGPIRSLLSLSDKGNSSGTGSSSQIICGSYGFRPQLGLNRKDLFGCISFWDADFPNHLPNFVENLKKRAELVEQMAQQQSQMNF